MVEDGEMGLELVDQDEVVDEKEKKKKKRKKKWDMADLRLR